MEEEFKIEHRIFLIVASILMVIRLLAIIYFLYQAFTYNKN